MSSWSRATTPTPITYTTGRQIRYFDDHDELYWNVTGNFWQFPILKASAIVITLPPMVSTATQDRLLYRLSRLDRDRCNGDQRTG